MSLTESQIFTFVSQNSDQHVLVDRRNPAWNQFVKWIQGPRSGLIPLCPSAGLLARLWEAYDKGFERGHFLGDYGYLP